jgi:hypothetical protein
MKNKKFFSLGRFGCYQWQLLYGMVGNFVVEA